MYNAINRMDGTSIDWSHAVQAGRKNNVEQQQAVSSAKNGGDMNSTLTKAEKERLFKEIDKVNEQMQAQNHSLRFKFSEEAEQFYVEVIDLSSQEVIDTIPAKHMIDLAAKLKDMIGFFIDEKL